MNGKDKTTRLKMIYAVVSVVLFGLLGIYLFAERQQDVWHTTYPVVILGDSITGQCRDETSVAAQLEEQIGKPVFNGAFGGTCMAMQQGADVDAMMDLLNMVSLSKAIVADDFGVQQTVRSTREITGHFEDTVDELDYIDFEQVETLVLAFGLNDYHAGLPLDNEENPFDESTYGGAIRSVLTTLGENYPNMEIVLVTPTYAWYLSNELTCEEYDTGAGIYLEDYVETEIAIAQEFGVKVINLYHDVYTHETWEDWQLYTEDGLHPNESSRQLLAKLLAKGLTE